MENVYVDKERDLFEIQLNRHSRHHRNVMMLLLMKRFEQSIDSNYDRMDVQYSDYDGKYRR
jgi:hypothetical protein